MGLCSALCLLARLDTKGDGQLQTSRVMNLLGAILVLANSLVLRSVSVGWCNAAWIAIGAYALARRPVHERATAAMRSGNNR